MSNGNRSKLARKRLLVVFLAVTIMPAMLAAWLAWRLLEQDFILMRERLREVRERRADEAVLSAVRALGIVAQQTRSLPSGAVGAPDHSLAYAVQPRLLPEAPAEVFAAGEFAEYRPAGSDEALAIYRKLTASPSAAIRAGAWLRLARTFRRLRRPDDAMQAYRHLREIDAAAAGGAPAPLAGQWAICRMHEEAGRTAELRKEGAQLRALLDAAASNLSRDVYELYAEDAARWSGKPRPVLNEALADAALSRPNGTGAGRFRGQFITWVKVDDRTLLLTEEQATRLLPTGPVRVRVAAVANKDETLRRAGDTGLPWTLAIALADPEKEQEPFAIRQRLLYALLGVMAAFGMGGCYLGWRLIRRELALAQMQSDLVAAVSHEFRTPLTSMRQVSAALSEGRVPDETRRQVYYEALARATERLHRMVEALLDFGKMESDAMLYRTESLDLAALVAGTAGDFSHEAAAKGFAVHTEIGQGEFQVKGDAEALRRALWNLLDNAMKYSGECRETWVSLSRNGREAFLRVIDNGIGIPDNEQREVFRKFFRGSASRHSRIPGSGIGLAMVNHIVRAHGGRVTLTSEPGKGSTFMIQLPTEE
ncbi:MAG: HAMP domain-containing histidine kinase [Bryobacterales bacterium]|nr:HAMP domain-containing histidine kinase [Bryobacterales bacterium]